MNFIKNNPKTTTTLLLAGLATGAAAWYFFGTDNGKKTLSQLTFSIKDISDSVMNKANDTLANLKTQKENYTA